MNKSFVKIFLFLIIIFSWATSYSSNIFDLPDSLDVEYAKAILNNVTENGNVSNLIDNTIPTLLPFGLSKEVAGYKQTIVLDSITFTPEGGFLTAYTAIKHPKSDDTVLAFKATNAQFDNGGFTGDARLQLIADADIKIADSTSLIFKKNGTYVEWGCNGFEQLGLNCEVIFDRNFIVPENPDGTIDSTGAQVTTQFQTAVQSWDELVIDISISPFQFRKLKGFGFYVTNAVFDFSELMNSPNIIFPTGYMTPSMPEPNSPFWQGFFLKQMQIKLPPEFKNNNSNERIYFEASNILIDELGFTGNLAGYNLLDLENGTAGGWAFSLDTISVSIFTNQFQNVNLGGDIQLPVMEDGTSLHYSGFIDNSGDYFLNVNLEDETPMRTLKFSHQ